MRGPRRTAAVAVATAAVTALAGPAPAALAAPRPADWRADGMELTARWWTAALADPSLSFLLEDSLTGGNCLTVELPSGPLVLAAGSLGGATGPRAGAVPAGATIVLPVLNNLYALTDPAPDDTTGEGRRVNREAVAGADVRATVDGEPVDVRRIRSSRFLLDGTALGLAGRTLPATSDGYWLVLTLEPGVHVVETRGQTPGFTNATSYTFVVG